MSKRYFLYVNKEKLDLAKGYLDFLVDEVIILPEIIGSICTGFIFTVKEEYQQKWDNFYFKLFEDNEIGTFGRIISEGNDSAIEDDRKLCEGLRLWS